MNFINLIQKAYLFRSFTFRHVFDPLETQDYLLLETETRFLRRRDSFCILLSFSARLLFLRLGTSRLINICDVNRMLQETLQNDI